MCCEPVLRLPEPFERASGADAHHLDLDPVAPSVGLARAFVGRVLGDLRRDDLDVAVLLTSELVTNAILHTRTPVQVGVLTATTTCWSAWGTGWPTARRSSRARRAATGPVAAASRS